MRFPFRIFKISGHSMEPALKAGSFALGYTWTKNGKTGDIIAFTYDGKILIKRIKSVSENNFIVAGDNKADSLPLPPIKKADLVGKVVWF